MARGRRSELWASPSISRETKAETAFGFQTDLTPLKKILAEIGKQIPLIPPALTGEQPNEKLLSYVVRAPSGRVLFQSNPQYSQEPEVTEPVGEHFGDLKASVVLNPEAAEVLVIGGLPKSRLLHDPRAFGPDLGHGPGGHFPASSGTGVGPSSHRLRFQCLSSTPHSPGADPDVW